MRLDKYLSRGRVVDLTSADMNGALEELLNVTVERFHDLDRGALLKGLLRRESTMTTYLGLGVALPHVRVKMDRRYILAVGRSHYGIRYDGAMESEPARLIDNEAYRKTLSRSIADAVVKYRLATTRRLGR